MTMNQEKSIDQYIGDVVGGLIREAGALRSRCLQLENIIREKNAKILELENTVAKQNPNYELDT